MNRIFITIITLSAFTNILRAQDGYIQYKDDVAYDNGREQVYKGEIVPFLNASNGKIDVIIGPDTTKGVTLDKTKFEKLTHEPNKSTTCKVLKKGNGVIFIDANACSDTIMIRSGYRIGGTMASLIDKRQINITEKDYGDNIRLIIPNTVTLWYSTDKLDVYDDPNKNPDVAPKNNDNHQNETRWLSFLEENTLMLILFIVASLIIFYELCKTGYYLYKRFFKPDSKSNNTNIVIPKKDKYFENMTFTDFAKKNGTQKEKIFEWNKIKIPNERDCKSKEIYNEKIDRIKHRLNGKDLIVGYENNNVSNESSAGQDNSTLPSTGQDIPYNELITIQNKIISDITNAGNNIFNILSEKLNTIDTKLTKSNNNNELVEFQKRYARLETEFKQLEEAKNSLDIRIENLTHNQSSANNENAKIKSEMNELNKKILRVDFLQNYATNVMSYLSICQKVVTEATSYVDKIDDSQMKNVAYILFNFQKNTQKLSVGKWLQIAEDIKETGVVANKEVIRLFSQLLTPNEKLNEFKKWMSKDFLISYCSSVLVLAETFSKLSYFGITSGGIESTFKNYGEELVNKAKTVSMEIKYIPLFAESNSEFELSVRDASMPYKLVKDLASYTVREVVSYGVKTEFDDTKTQIIIA